MIGLRGGRFRFDGEEIFTQLSKAEVKVFSRFGAYVMTTSRQSMRKPNKKGEASKPGLPPKARLGHIKRGRYAVQFAWDSTTRSLVVGPEIFPGIRKRTTENTNVETIEKGGAIRFEEAQKRDGTWSIAAMRWADKNHSPVRESKGKYEARPFMQPALKKNQGRLAGMWKDAIN